MKGKIMRVAAGLILAAGIALFCYPYAAQWQYNRESGAAIREFDNRAKQLSETKKGSGEAPYLPTLYAAMQAYNEDLYRNGQDGFRDAWSYQPASFDLTQYGLPDNMVGYIDIPEMDITLPIYLGATQENMSLGAVHLTQTSLPIGGDNTNCVIAAHRGYSRAAMFRDIEKLKAGDDITITNLWGKLTYRVEKTKIIRPTDVKEVMIQPGRDLLTLITCHPKRENYQRYVVYCKRVR